MTFLHEHTGPVEYTPQTLRADPRQVMNEAGGYVFPVDGWARLDRWLILGTEGGTYYASQQKLTEENIAVVRECVKLDGKRVVARISEVSQGGLAAKQDYGLFALAMCLSASNVDTRVVAFAALPKIARTGSSFYQTLSYLRGLRSSKVRDAKGQQPALFTGNGMKRAVQRWFRTRSVEQLAYQFVKYRQRYGLTMRDALRLSHDASGEDIARHALYDWALGKANVENEAALPQIVQDYEHAATTPTMGNRVDDSHVTLAKRLPREALPTEWLNDQKVWEALLYGNASADDDEAVPSSTGMPITALIRNLGNLSKCGLLVAGSDAERYVCGELRNATRLRAARVHPIALYLASKVYAQGRAVKGDGIWKPSKAVVEALEDGFELAFANVEPTGKHLVIGIDVSGSMGSPVNGYPMISCDELAATFAFVIGRTEPNARIIAFSDRSSGVQEYPVSSDERLRDFVRRIKPGGGTDLSIPITWATAHVPNVNGIVILTDNETWAGSQHPHQALKKLRGLDNPVRAVVIAATATGGSIVADDDRLALGIGGFSANAPQLVREFLNGSI